MNRIYAVLPLIVFSACTAAPLLGPAAVYGQDAAAPQPPASSSMIIGVNDPRNTYHLTVDQQQKALAIEKSFEKNVSGLPSNKALTDKQRVADFVNYQNEARAEFVKLLTPSQKTIFDDSQKQQRTFMKGSLEARGEAVVLQKKFMSSMTSAQRKKWDAFNRDGEIQIQNIESDSTLTSQKKADKEQSLRAGMQSKLKTFLTASQLQMLSSFSESYAKAIELQKLATDFPIAAAHPQSYGR